MSAPDRLEPPEPRYDAEYVVKNCIDTVTEIVADRIANHALVAHAANQSLSIMEIGTMFNDIVDQVIENVADELNENLHDRSADYVD